jgi:outer membrane protein
MHTQGTQARPLTLPALAVAFSVLLGAALPARAEDLPRLELGAGVALLTRPYYRGSAQSSSTLFPAPYLVYRGERLQLSREGLMARLFKTEDFRVSLSLAASLPGHDSEDSLRSGMPDLLPTFEAGPSLDWMLDGEGGAWKLRLPVRAVAAADFKDFEGIGWLVHPHLQFRHSRQQGRWALETALAAGPLWASQKYHRYFYAVEPQYATAERPAYDPGGGYSGARASAYLGLRRGAWRLGLGITHDALNGAEMEDSPLVETEQATVFALGLFYSFLRRDHAAPDALAP